MGSRTTPESIIILLKLLKAFGSLFGTCRSQPKDNIMKKILIVEDDADLLEVVGIILAKEGYEVRSTSQSDEVHQVTVAYQPDLIILDFLLAGKDGGSLCQGLKLQVETSKIPIIIFSAHPMAEKSIEDSGADFFIAKPFDVTEFIKTIRSYTE